ncbi:MAG: hypothetical protein LBC79_00085 [Deltaproteobacteria bacterium]|jgi:hypothetical protein|nr:hypothetical protein [Deltaproteobacteria bacterium]
MTACRNTRLFDLAFVFCTLVFALLAQHTALSPESGGTRYIDSDAQQLVAFAAGLDHPEAFARDPLLANAETFGWYKSIHVPLIRWLAQGKDYGLAYAKLTGIHQFVHLTGFYLLGLCFLRQRWLAACFAVVASLEFWFGWGCFWGSLRASVPLPGVTYTALFSLLCAAMLIVRRRYRFWPLIFLGMGALVHVHAISALGVGFAMWLGLCHFRPEGFTRKRHLMHMLLAGICFVLPATPFIINHLNYWAVGELNRLCQADILFLRVVAEYRVEHTITRLGPQLWNFVIQMLTQPPLLPLALLGGWAVYRYGNDRERDLLPMLGLWTLGIVLTAAAHALDQESSRRFGWAALEYDMVRDIRFLPFFFFIAAFMGFSIYWDAGILQTRFAWARRIPVLLAALVFVLFLLQGAVQSILFSLLPLSAEQAAIRSQERANGELIRALGELTPPGSKIFLESGDYLVRYAALRNLAFSHKDGAILLYGKNLSGLRDWYPMSLEMGNPTNLGSIDKTPRPASAPETMLACALRTDSDYLVVSAPAALPLLQKAGTIIWNNSHYVMLHLARESRTSALKEATP